MNALRWRQRLYKTAQGGLWRGPKTVAGVGRCRGFIVYFIKAGLLPVRFRPPIAGAVDRWPEGGAGGVLPGAAALHHSGGSD